MVLVVDDDEAIRESFADLLGDEGYQVQTATIPIVVISADKNVALKATGIQGEFLPKPVRLDTVLGVLGRHCL